MWIFMGAAKGPLYRVPFRRRRENRTNYTKRLAHIKSPVPRLVVRATNRALVAQIIAFDAAGDKVLASAYSGELAAYGWMPQANTPTAYLVGLLAGVRAKKAGHPAFHLDIGMATASRGRILFAGALGAKAAGMETDVDEKLLDAKRLDGSHISEYAKKMKGEEAGRYARHFSRYIGKNIDPTALPALFGTVKGKILSG